MAQDANQKLAENKGLADLSAKLSPGYDENMFGCLSDVTGCVLSFCVPCIVAAATKATLDERPCTICDCLCASNPYQNRQSIRSKYKKAYDPIMDCVATICCMCCAVHQDARELGKLTGKPPVFMMTP